MSSTTANLPPPATKGPIPAAIDLLHQEVDKTTSTSTSTSQPAAAASTATTSSFEAVPASTSSAQTLTNTSHVLPDPDHALPTNALVSETAKLQETGQGGLGGAKEPSFESAVGTAPGQLTPGGITPGQELPGGWGSTKVATPQTTIYQDVNSGLNAVGQAAYNAVPASLIDKFSSQSISEPTATHPISTTTNTLPHEKTAPTTTSTSIIPEGVKNTVAGAAASLPSVEQVKASIPSVHEVKAAIPSVQEVKSAVLPASTSSPAAGPITDDLPTLEEVKQVVVEEATGLFAQAKTFLGYGSPTSSTKEATLPISHKSYPEESVNSPLAGGGGLAATIAPEIAEAAKHSEATSVGDVPLTSSPKVHPPVTSSTTPLAGARESAAVGGGAAAISDAVAEAARDSHATSVGGTHLTSTPVITSSVEHTEVTGREPLISTGGPITDHPASSASTSTSTPLAGNKESAAVGGGAAAISDAVAEAARDSHATSVGGTHLTSTPVITSSAEHTEVTGKEPLISTGGPIVDHPAPATAPVSETPVGLGAPIAPIQTDNLASTLKLPSDSSTTNTTTPPSPHHADTPSATKALNSTTSTPTSASKNTTTGAPVASTVSHTSAASASSSTESPTSPGGTHKKKPSFGDKLKGEFKVLSGKLGHDEKKVAEGEKLKSGEL